MMRKVLKKSILFIPGFLLITWQLKSQDIPLGAWRLHNSFNSVADVATGNGKVFGASASAILVLESDNSLSTITRLSGLSGTGISALSYDVQKDKLVVGYEDGTIDLVGGNSIVNFTRIRNSQEIVGSKRINDIQVRDDFAYLASDFGVVVFDLGKDEVKETWRALGKTGNEIRIYQSTFKNDSIFLATSEGIIGGDLDDNLLDFAAWKRFNSGSFSGEVNGIHALNNGVLYASVPGSGLYSYDGFSWSKEPNFDGSTLYSMTGSTDLILIESEKVWRNDVVPELIDIAEVTVAQAVLEDATGALLVGDRQKGLIKFAGQQATAIKPNGPAHQVTSRLVFHTGEIWAVHGGFSSLMTPLANAGDVDVFQNGSWSTFTSPLLDITDVNIREGFVVSSSFGGGVQVGPVNQPVVVFDTQNSTLVSSPSGILCSALAADSKGIWVANYGATDTYHHFTNGDQWEAFSFSASISRYPLELLADAYDNVWSVLNPSVGGGLFVFNSESGQSVYLSNSVGVGGLPNRNVYALAIDHDGYIWVGTAEGVGYFPNPGSVFKGNVNLIRPIFENRYLLNTETITAIAVDGGNRKWIGTLNGLWLFDPTGEQLIHNFNELNSPLPSSSIMSIAINDQTGEVFVSTQKGLVSFRSDASRPSDFESVIIFPNPVLPSFRGSVGIQGLTEDALVKITDVSGKLVFQTQANGGTASWNLGDTRGKRIQTGVYLVFCTSMDGTDSLVGKIAIVE